MSSIYTGEGGVEDPEKDDVIAKLRATVGELKDRLEQSEADRARVVAVKSGLLEAAEAEIARLESSQASTTPQKVRAASDDEDSESEDETLDATQKDSRKLRALLEASRETQQQQQKQIDSLTEERNALQEDAEAVQADAVKKFKALVESLQESEKKRNELAGENELLAGEKEVLENLLRDLEDEQLQTASDGLDELKDELRSVKEEEARVIKTVRTQIQKLAAVLIPESIPSDRTLSIDNIETEMDKLRDAADRAVAAMSLEDKKMVQKLVNALMDALFEGTDYEPYTLPENWSNGECRLAITILEKFKPFFESQSPTKFAVTRAINAFTSRKKYAEAAAGAVKLRKKKK